MFDWVLNTPLKLSLWQNLLKSTATLQKMYLKEIVLRISKRTQF